MFPGRHPRSPERASSFNKARDYRITIRWRQRRA